MPPPRDISKRSPIQCIQTQILTTIEHDVATAGVANVTNWFFLDWRLFSHFSLTYFCWQLNLKTLGLTGPRVFSELSPVLCWGISKYQLPVTMKNKLPEGSLTTNLTASKDTTLYRPWEVLASQGILEEKPGVGGWAMNWTFTPTGLRTDFLQQH